MNNCKPRPSFVWSVAITALLLAAGGRRALAADPNPTSKVGSKILDNKEYICVINTNSNQIECTSSYQNWVNGWKQASVNNCVFYGSGAYVEWDPATPQGAGPAVFAMAHCSFDSKDHIIGCYLDDKGQPSCISDFTAPDVGLGPRMGVAYSSHDQELTLWAVEQTGANAGHLWRFMKKAGQANSRTDVSATVGGFFTGR